MTFTSMGLTSIDDRRSHNAMMTTGRCYAWVIGGGWHEVEGYPTFFKKKSEKKTSEPFVQIYIEF